MVQATDPMAESIFVLDRHPFSFALEMFRIVGMSTGIFISLYIAQMPQYYVFSLLPAVVFIPWIIKRKDSFKKEKEVKVKVRVKTEPTQKQKSIKEAIREEEPSLI